MQLYLHVGLPKTGTTAIQQFLFHNREVLKQSGILYPDTALHWCQHVPLVKALISPRFSDAIFNEAVERIDAADWLNSVAADSLSNHWSTVILSSEFFWAAPAMQSPLEYHQDNPANLTCLEEAIRLYRDALAIFDDIKVIFFLRRQDKWLESFFNQQLKNGFPIPSEQELLPARIYLLYEKNLALWAKYFGEENLIVYTFEETGSDIVGNFCTIVGIEPDESLFNRETDGAVNPRLSSCGLRIMRKAIEKNVSREMLEQLGEVLTHSSAAIPSKLRMAGSGVFPRKMHTELLSVYKEDNIKLAKLYPSTSIYLEDTSLADQDEDQIPVDDSGCWEWQMERLLEILIMDYQIPEETVSRMYKSETS